MARHHVISTTACDVFFKLVAHQKKSLGARFDSMIVTFSADGQPVRGAALRNATTGKVKRIYLAAISSALLSSTYLDAGATSRIADAEINSVHGTPCFTISQTEENRNGQPLLGALSISDLSVKPATKVWSYVMSGGRKIPLSSKSCLLYGDIPQGANGMPAPELQTGRVYSIFLNGRPDDPSDPTYGYRGKFCIAATSADERKIIAIGSGTPAWKHDHCPEHSLVP